MGKCVLNVRNRVDDPASFFHMPGIDYYHRNCLEPRIRSRAATDCFEQIKGKVLIGIVDQLVSDISNIAKCQTLCEKAQKDNGIVCKSAMYYAKDKECILASQNKADIPDLYIDDPNAVYIENKCATGAAAEASKAGNASPQAPQTPAPPASRTTQDVFIQPITPAASTTPLIAAVVPDMTSVIDPEKSGVGPQVESSGYNAAPPAVAPSDTISKQIDSVDQNLVDTYGVTPKPYRVLRDMKINKCFSMIFPSAMPFEHRVLKAFSLEQCIDMCRLCSDCLVDGLKCQSIAYHSAGTQCALSASRPHNIGLQKPTESDLQFYIRGNC